MTTLLNNHLEQISLCASSIASLPFAGPKIFTNALLSPNHDITSLIRDTEQHERALFHLAPPPLPPKSAGNAGDFGVSAAASMGGSTTGAARRATQYGGGVGGGAAAARQQPKNKAVAAVLGGDLYQRTRLPGYEREREKKAGEIDVEVLLQGAEKLAAVYPMSGATEKIHALRRRHQQLEANIAHYEARVAEQTRELQAMSRPKARESFLPDDAEVKAEEIPLTKEDLAREEEEVRELERKKKGLEERVEGMERDLGGLMR